MGRKRGANRRKRERVGDSESSNTNENTSEQPPEEQERISDMKNYDLPFECRVVDKTRLSELYEDGTNPIPEFKSFNLTFERTTHSNMSYKSEMRKESSSSEFSQDEDYFEVEDHPIIVGKNPNRKTFGSCRLLLSSFSDVFRAMFYGPLAEKEEVELPEDDPFAFQIMIDFMFTGEIRLETVQDAVDVYQLVDKYQVLHVREKCVDYLLQNISIENVIETYEMATEFSEDVLKTTSFDYICKNATEVLKSKSFIDSKFSTVKSIIKQDNINVSSELDVYKAIFLWLKEECRRKREEGNKLKARAIVEPLLPEIRFLTLTVEEFCGGPGRNIVLTDQEKLSLLTNIISPNSVELPEQFSKSRTKRHHKFVTRKKLTSTHTTKSIKFYRGAFLEIKQTSKLFSTDTYICGVSFKLGAIQTVCTQFQLTIRNITRSEEISKLFSYALTTQDVVELITNDSILIKNGEACEISLTGFFDKFEEVYCCDGDCQLDEFYASNSVSHFHDIFIYRIE